MLGQSKKWSFSKAESSLWTPGTHMYADPKTLSSSALWTKKSVTGVPLVTEMCSLFKSLCVPLGIGLSRGGSFSYHPGSSLILILTRLLFHLFQSSSSTLRRQEDTCSNYSVLWDASVSCQTRQISGDRSSVIFYGFCLSMLSFSSAFQQVIHSFPTTSTAFCC